MRTPPPAEDPEWTDVPLRDVFDRCEWPVPGREDCDARVVVFLVVVPEMWEPYCDPVTVPWVNGGALPSTSSSRSTAVSNDV